MKTLTCRQLGGPCDFELRGNSADEIIKAQDRHLKDAVADGDSSHEDASNEMKTRWRRPASGLSWYRATKRAFAELPES
jgi:predicted small metal-binding protein